MTIKLKKESFQNSDDKCALDYEAAIAGLVNSFHCGGPFILTIAFQQVLRQSINEVYVI